LHECLTFGNEPKKPYTARELVVMYGTDGIRRNEGMARITKDLAAIEDRQMAFGSEYRRAYLNAMTRESALDHQGAADAFAIATKLSNTEDERYISIWGQARSYHHLRIEDVALRHYQAMADMNRSRAEGWIGAAQIAYSQKRFSDAIVSGLNASLCEFPRNTILYDQACYSWLPHEIMGHASLAAGVDTLRALDCFRMALAQSASNPEARDRLARIVERLHWQFAAR
jgi:hypothetical protein